MVKSLGTMKYENSLKIAVADLEKLRIVDPCSPPELNHCHVGKAVNLILCGFSLSSSGPSPTLLPRGFFKTNLNISLSVATPP